MPAYCDTSLRVSLTVSGCLMTHSRALLLLLPSSLHAVSTRPSYLITSLGYAHSDTCCSSRAPGHMQCIRHNVQAYVSRDCVLSHLTHSSVDYSPVRHMLPISWSRTHGQCIYQCFKQRRVPDLDAVVHVVHGRSSAHDHPLCLTCARDADLCIGRALHGLQLKHVHVSVGVSERVGECEP